MGTAKKKLEVWHEGEQILQGKVGVAERMADLGKRIIRDYLPEQHRAFFAQVPFVVLGSVDGQGDAWATLLAGKPGFISSPDDQELDIAARVDPSDPASVGTRDGDAIGLLGIELHTRRRNRVNGYLRPRGEGLHVEVDQSFGNCPQYIQLRDYQLVRDPREPYAGEVEQSAQLDADARAMITAADTFFVASYADRGRRQVDVSHRGGKAGFVRIDADGSLTIPDFAGNLFFATLGNLLLNGKAGLVFVDFESGDMLQLSGDAEVVLDSPEVAAFQGAERLWRFRARHVVRRRGALALRWAFREDGWSPNSLMTGDWQQAAERVRAAQLAQAWRPFKVTQIVDESASIRSFHLQPEDGAGRIPNLAGQHLPIRVTLPGERQPSLRTYTLSVAPSDPAYRISVKREGVVSSYLHDHVHVGDVIEARAPAGSFTLDALQERPAVLVAAGVGITPMLAMLRHVIYEGLRKRGIRPTVLFQAAHSKAERAFDAELAELEEKAQGALHVVRVLSDVAGAVRGVDYDASGRIDVALLSRFLSFGDYDFYVCGPAAFTQSLYDGLRALDVADDRIHAEAFGPSSLVRTGSTREAPSSKDVPVVFTKALKEARWTPQSGTLLELAEARGLNPPFSCRTGSCGSCKTRLLAGSVTYVRDTSAPHAEDEVLICSAVPATQDGPLQLEL